MIERKARTAALIFLFGLGSVGCASHAAGTAIPSQVQAQSAPRGSMTSVSATSGDANTAIISFTSAPGVYHYAPGLGTATLSFDGFSCPSVSASTVRTPYRGCSGSNPATLTFSVPPGKELTVARNNTVIAVRTVTIPKHTAIHPPQPGSQLTSLYFDEDAFTRSRDISHSSQRPIELARSTQAITGVTGVSQGTRVAYIARGIDEQDSTVYTRVYWFVYNPLNGSLVKYGDRIASDTTSDKYGFPENHVPISDGGQ